MRMKFWKSWKGPARLISKIIYVSKQNDISEHMRFCNYTPLILFEESFRSSPLFLGLIFDFWYFLDTQKYPRGGY